jgi:Asp-tRNA(Asn)/Glu-tRNA(Gln) amidotransferase A subunit family amidase
MGRGAGSDRPTDEGGAPLATRPDATLDAGPAAEAEFAESAGGRGRYAPAAAFSDETPMPRRLEQQLPYEFPDATELLRRLRDGLLTAPALIEDHLQRIAREQPRLNASTQVLGDRAIAEASSPQPGPLAGLPVSVKESISLAGHHITVGSRRMPAVEAAGDAAAVTALREAGAIVVARGNLPELGLSSETDNLRFGRTNNPLDVNRTSGGSSGGDAALVASGCVAAALASDTFGSIRIPAAFCGVVGYKPAGNAVDKRGAWPPLKGFLDRWHAVGTITRSVRDARLVGDVLTGPIGLPPLLEELEFVVPDPFPLKLQQPAIQSAWRRAERVLELAGLRRVRLDFEQIGELTRDVGAVMAAELGPVLDELLTGDDGARFSLLGESWRRVRGQASVSETLFRAMRLMPMVKPRGEARTTELIERYLDARERFAALIGPNRLLLLPTIGLLAPPHGEMDRQVFRPGLNEMMTPVVMCNFLDLAAIALPAWSDRDPRSGLPPSVLLACVPGSEPALFAAATALERVLGVPGHAEIAGREPRLTTRVGRRRGR